MKQLYLDDFDAIAFDVEGTLADTIPTHHAARLQAFSRHGYGHITRDQHELGPTYGSSTADIVGGILHAAGGIEKHGPFSQHPVIQEVIASKKELFEAAAAKGFEEMPQATAFVQRIAPLFMGRMALVTSAPERFVLPFVERYAMTHHFPGEHIVSEDTILAHGLEGKPAPDPYRLAMERLNTSKLLVFEDTVSGVTSAKKAGATVVALGFDRHNARLFALGDLSHPPDILVRSYEEARKFLGIYD